MLISRCLNHKFQNHNKKKTILLLHFFINWWEWKIEAVMMNVPSSSFREHASSGFVMYSLFKFLSNSENFILFYFAERKRNRKTDEEKWRRRAGLCLYWKRKEFVTNDYPLRDIYPFTFHLSQFLFFIDKTH